MNDLLAERSAEDDALCAVCGGGDSDKDSGNEIVFCERCDVAVHQKCYGVPVNYTEDWTCDVCLTFGENGKYLRCPFCDKRGGAMKPTCTRSDTRLLEHSNPSYHEFLHSYVRSDLMKTLPKAKSLSKMSLKANNSGIKKIWIYI